MSTIAAIATPPATGGISVIRISGEKAFDIAAAVFKPVGNKTIAEMKGYTAAYGNIYGGEGGKERLDDGVLLVFRAPHSYTGEDVAELTCHGGVLITRRVLRACLDAGARLAEAGEFTRRALIAGKMTLTQAEAVADIINSKSDQFLKCAAAQLDGALYQKISAIKQTILDLATEISAWIDYPDELDSFEISSKIGQLTDCRLKLKLLLESFDVGQALRDGISAAIVGKPNVGKSTLMNLLVGCERSIVTDIEGTTTDIVEENVILGGALLRIADCAGIRETNNPVERIGVIKMEKRLEHSQLIFAVFDYSRPLEAEDYKLIEKLKGRNVLCVINKLDLENKLDMAYLAAKFGKVVEISANDPKSLKLLNEAVSKLINPEKLDISAGFIANERQRAAAVKAETAIEAAIDGINKGVTLDAAGVMLESALDSLMELTGENVSDEIIDQVFKRFCVGK
ncbi:MAG: tRNA uridine-5-carboxymethylaminomethyl(34) synthesis GTPase MnmE [Ruminococcaceae bacterium]|nr:tRNA uridine-5-carboxymethylaminomethyl(34) synthesis GTPase MnmE [Oscillospiraceae bacterium]